ncbi:MAG: protein translocase subunit SecF [Candidatus Gracilibacteria bacterium]
MHFDFIARRSWLYGISIGLTLFSLAAPFLFSPRFGIDLTGGTLSEYSYSGQINIETVNTTVKDALNSKTEFHINTINAYRIAGASQFVVEVGYNKGLNDGELEKIKQESKILVTDALKKSFPNENIGEPSRYVNIGESFGKHVKERGIQTLILVVLSISCYIAYAFRGTLAGISSFSFGVVTAASLFHDVIITAGLYLLVSSFFPEFTIDTFFITAILTVLGYSINDTIVVMDRIRSILRERVKMKKGEDLHTLINRSVHETLTRSIYTSTTVVIVLVVLFFFGPETLRGFMLAMIFGAVIGTYSSIAIAAPMLYDMVRSRESDILTYRDPKKSEEF